MTVETPGDVQNGDEIAELVRMSNVVTTVDEEADIGIEMMTIQTDENTNATVHDFAIELEKYMAQVEWNRDVLLCMPCSTGVFMHQLLSD